GRLAPARRRGSAVVSGRHAHHAAAGQRAEEKYRRHRQACRRAGADADHRHRLSAAAQGLALRHAPVAADHLSGAAGAGVRSAAGRRWLHGRARALLPQRTAELLASMTMPSATHVVLIPSYNPGPKVFETVTTARSQWAPVWVVVDGSTD